MDIEGMRRRARRGLLTATGHLTATEGPLRVALDELGQRGVGARVIKGSLAAAVAWAVAGQITPASLPFVASLTALFTVQLTIAQSVTQGRQRLLGVLVGISVAFGVSELVGLHSWSMGIVALVAITVGLRLRLESGGVEQVAATAIVVMFVQSTADQRLVFAASHLLDTVIGTAVGLTLNALVAPPDYVPAARRAVQSLGRRLVFVLEDTAAALADGATAEQADDLLVAVRVVEGELADIEAALARAEEGLRFNIVGARQQEALARCRALGEDLRGLVYRSLTLASTMGGGVAMGRLALPAAEEVSAVAVALLDRVDRFEGDIEMASDERFGVEVATRSAALGGAAEGWLAGSAPGDTIRVVPIVGAVLALEQAMGET